MAGLARRVSRLAVRVALGALGALGALVGFAAGPTLARAQGHAHPASEGLGELHFATSCRPAVAPGFDRAVALLHSFEFSQAIAAFDRVLAGDSTCAMAAWGIALSRWTNPFVAGARSSTQLQGGREAAARAARLAAGATDRERGYIAAVARLYDDFEHVGQRDRILAYEGAMRTLVSQQPADTEAAIFHALALAASAPPADKSYARQLEAAQTLEALVRVQPRHPGLQHYLIHSYDVPALAARGLHAAEQYATVAPSAAHALHMPSHIFTRVGAWDASIATNLKSIETARRGGSIAEALHASDYAMYAYLQTGRDRAARGLLRRLPALARRFDANAIGGAAPGSAGVFALAAIPARFALERRAWAEAAALVPTASAWPWTESLTLLTRALGAAHTGDLRRAREARDSLGAIHLRLVAAREDYWAEQVAIEQLEAAAWLAFAEHRTDDALAAMREASTREAATEKNAVTPGPLAPASELLGDLLLATGRSAEARAAYEATLVREPNRFRALYGAMRAASLAGDAGGAARHATRLLELCAKADPKGRPALAEARRLAR